MGVACVPELVEELADTRVQIGHARRLAGGNVTDSPLYDVSPVRLAVSLTIATVFAQIDQSFVEGRVLLVGQDIVLESSELCVVFIWFTRVHGFLLLFLTRAPRVPSGIILIIVIIPEQMVQHTGVLLGLETEILSSHVAASHVTEHASSRRRAEVIGKVRAWDVAGLHSHQAVRLRGILVVTFIIRQPVCSYLCTTTLGQPLDSCLFHVRIKKIQIIGCSVSMD